MEIVLELYGSLILTVLGFVLPILTILLSLFPDGVKVLATKYENERKQSDDNILTEIQKKKSKNGLDYNALEKTLSTLKKKKHQAETKLAYLKPTQLIVKIFLPFIVALAGVAVALQTHSLVALISSAIAFLCGIYTLWMSLRILIEVTEVVNQTKRDADDRVVELLSNLVKRSSVDSLFLKKEELKLKFNNKVLKQDEFFEFSVNRQYEIPISIMNASEKMAKKVQVGLVFPKDFLIEKTSNLSIFTDEKNQIIRFNNEIVQAQENYLKGKMLITFLSTGEYKIKTFIKGENVQFHQFAFNLKVIE